jgi:hypothetical protein
MKKRILFPLLAIIILAVFLTACSASSATPAAIPKPAASQAAVAPAEGKAAEGDYEDLNGDSVEEAPAASAAAPAPDNANGTNADAGFSTTMVVPNSANKIILNKYIETKTKDFDGDLKQLETALKASGGYIQDSNVTGVKPKVYEDPGRAAHYVFRIPRLKVDEFLSTALKVGEVDVNKDSSQDITSQYMDTESRLKTLRIELDRFQELEKKATKMSDIIELEDKIQQVTYEIESLQGQIRGWDNLVDYATVEMNIEEVNTVPQSVDKPKPIDQPDYGKQLGDGFVSVLNGVLDFFKTLLLVLFSGLPIIVPAAVIVVVILLWVRAAKKKKLNKMDNTNQM